LVAFGTSVCIGSLADGQGWAVRMSNHGNSLNLPYTIWVICV
jgi:hypothetical protein